MRPSLAAMIAALAAVGTACSTDADHAGDETSRRAATSAEPTATVPATDEPPSPSAATNTTTTATAASSTEECCGEPTEPTTAAYLTVDGVRPDLLSVDVYRPTSAPACPVALWVHGGGWRNGDKRGKGTDTKVAYFAESAT